MVTLNQIKKTIRKCLPKRIFDFIQKIRSLGYKPPIEIETLRLAFVKLQETAADENEMVLRPGLLLKLHPESRMPFSWFCWRSPEMVAELNLFIKLARGKQTFADVGANHGIFSLVFLKLNPEGSVLSVDPSPIADEIRKVNRVLNGMESSLTCYQVACGKEVGTVEMHYNWHHLEASGKGDGELAAVSVPVRPLDALCTHEPPRSSSKSMWKGLNFRF